MRIKYDMDENYFKCYNESQGIIVNKNEIIKNPKFKLYNYVEKGLINILLIIIILICSKVLEYMLGPNIFTRILELISNVSLGLMILYFVLFYFGYSIEKGRKHEGYLEVDSEGIKDFSSDGMVVGFSWENIKAVVIKKHTINILTDNSIYFFIDITYKERLLIAIERYQPNLLIIDKTK